VRSKKIEFALELLMDHSAVAAAPRMRWEYAAPSLAALAYPFLLQGHIAGLKAGYPSLAWLQLGLAFGVSLLGFVASVRLGQQPHPDAGAVIARRLVWLAVAAPPLYTGMGVLLTMAGDPLADTTLWLAFWITAPLLVVLFGFQLVSGLQMLRSLSARPADVLHTLQAVSAAYLLFFILAHMNSVFFYARRFAGIPTDWNFATGAPTGLLHDAWNIRLVPHYTLGVFLVLAHLLLGLRQVLLAHGRSAMRVDAWTWAGIGAAALFALAVMNGMSGVHLLSMSLHTESPV